MVIQKLSTSAIKKRSFNRLVPTLQYLRELHVKIMCKEKGDKRPLELISEIQSTIESSQPRSIYVYTDGSTDPRANKANSGLGIVIMDPDNQ